MRISRRILSGAIFALLLSLTPGVGGASASPGKDEPTVDDLSLLWQPVTDAIAKQQGDEPQVDPDEFTAYALDRSDLESRLSAAPAEDANAAPQVVSLPDPTGGFMRFAVFETRIMQPQLAARNPDITTYAGRSLDNPRLTVRMDLTSLGFHASVRGPAGQGSWYIDPYYNRDQSVYVSYFGDDLTENPHGTFVEKVSELEEAQVEHALEERARDVARAGKEVRLRTYRLAFLTDPTYASYFGSANVLDAKVTLMNRVNQIYEDDLAIRMILIDETDKLNFDTAEKMTGANGPCGTAACFTEAQATGGCTGGLLNRNRIVLGQLVDASDYDIGHIGLGLNGGGVAGLGVVGRDGKARGCTGLPDPVGDFYAVDYVAHEMGHQFSGNHTFNGTQGACSGNKAAPAVEPGSGSSVMAYAGICRQDNLTRHSDPYFSQRSLTEINAYVSSEQSPVDEVQNVALRNFDTDGESFRLKYGENMTEPFQRGTSYNTATLTVEITRITGRPVEVSGFAGATAPNDNGFQARFTGSGTDLLQLRVVDATGDVSGFTGETAWGGPARNGGFTVEPTGNHAPVVTSAGNHTIPRRTPFALTGSATDADGDVLTYMWEQNDAGTGTGTALTDNTKRNGPLFAQFGVQNRVTDAESLLYNSPGQQEAGTSPTRIFPNMKQILSNNTNAKDGTCPPPPPESAQAPYAVPYPIITCFAEFLPTGDYIGGDATSPATLKFRLTVRDTNPGAGGVSFADTTLTLADAGPFLVTSQGNDPTIAGGTMEPITWDVNGTDASNLAPQVRILLSTNGGQTFPTVLAASTPNDGSETLRIPSLATDEARIKIEAVDNVFFDVNDADFSITNAAPVAQDDSFTTQGNGEALLDVLANDSDANGDLLSILSVGSAEHGTVEVAGDKLRYVRDAGYVGPDSFTYTVGDGQLSDEATVSLDVQPGPAAPVARRGFAKTTTGDPVDIRLDGDDADRDTLTYTVTDGEHGSVTVEGKTATYTPEPGFVGTDTFTFTVSDGVRSDTGTVGVRVTRRTVSATIEVSNRADGADRVRIAVTPAVRTSVTLFRLRNGEPEQVRSFPTGRRGVARFVVADAGPRRATTYFARVRATTTTHATTTERRSIL